jgi:hypothetical protein
MPVVSCMLLVKLTRTRSPSLTRIVGPGTWALKPSASIGAASSSTMIVVSSTVRLKTFTPASMVGVSGVNRSVSGSCLPTLMNAGGLESSG